MSDINLFEDETPPPKKKAESKKYARPSNPDKIPTDGKKDFRSGNSKRNKKRIIDARPGNITDLQSCLVATNHKLKYKADNVEEEMDVLTLIRKVYDNVEAFLPAVTIIEEDDDGDTEYKLKLVDTSRERIQQLTSQMKFRVKEGHGEAFYKIGYEDNGNPLGLSKVDMEQSLNSLCHISNELRVELVVQKILRGNAGMVAEIAIREVRECVKFGIKIMLMGESGSGKSTLVY